MATPPHNDAARRLARPTMRDVAALAGVGIKTVSRVVNHEPNVSPEMVERVMAAARSLDFEPDLGAGNLRRGDGRTRTLGLVVGSAHNPFAGAVHRAVEDIALARGSAVLVGSLDDDPAREERVVSEFLRRRVDGLVLTPASASQAYLEPWLLRGTPVVFLDRDPVDLVADAVTSDHRAGARAATAHLLARGHRRVAYLGDRQTIQTAGERLAGFAEEIAAAGLRHEDQVIVEGLRDEASAGAALGEILDSTVPPAAVFAAQNLITIGALRALRERGLHRTTALVGFDDVPLGDLLDPGVSVVAQDPWEIGRRGRSARQHRVIRVGPRRSRARTRPLGRLLRGACIPVYRDRLPRQVSTRRGHPQILSTAL
ncbi:MAG: LacI family DNA-binding transcriptional regulator [Cellulomonadaceae bacterium]